MHDGEIIADLPTARRLVAAQFPQWRALPLSPVRSTGTDNVVFRLGDALALRFPRTAGATAQAKLERRCLPLLADGLPVAVPQVVAVGEPGDGYPWPWLVSRWIGGRTPDPRCFRGAGGNQLAGSVAAFLRALQAMDPASAPLRQPGQRGGALGPLDAEFRAAVVRLGEPDQTLAALRIWDAALSAPPWSGAPVWLHGDVLPGNLILGDAELRGVIDWSCCGAGDPACDLMIAWQFDSAARATLRQSLDVDDAGWLRGRGWALLQAVLFIPYYAGKLPGAVAEARHRLNAVLAG